MSRAGFTCLTVVELARYWRRRPSAIREKIRKGELRAFTLDGHVRISPEEVARYEAEHQIATAKPKKRAPRRDPNFVEYF